MHTVLPLNRRLLTLLFAGAVSPLLAGCGGGGSGASQSSSLASAVKTDVTNSTPVSANVIAANNNLGFALFSQLNAADSTSNIFISPASIALALDMTYNGAAGTTQQAMAQAMQLNGISLQDLNDGAAALEASLVDPGPDVTLAVANSAWFLKVAGINQSFITADQTYYGAKIGSLAGAPGNVEAWVSQQTHGLITDPLPSGIDWQHVTFLLLNTLYFKGTWEYTFPTSATVTAPFTLADGSQVKCPMMAQTNSFSYYQGSNFQMVSLPYGKGRMSMVIVLPASGTSLSTLASGFTLSTWSNWIAQMQAEKGAVYLPRFKSGYSVSLVDALTALGMGIAFTPEANFSNLATGLSLSFVQHATSIAVDENGTVAAAVTAVGGVSGGVSAQFTMRVDRPFFYAICDSKSGQILFLGVMRSPALTSS